METSGSSIGVKNILEKSKLSRASRENYQCIIIILDNGIIHTIVR
jgi:hypothetical protein